MIFEPGFIHKIPAIPSSVTAEAILAALLTVDGSGSGLDADLLDGQHGAFYTSYTDTAIANHLVAGDPHPQYLTQTEADILYSPFAHQHKLNDLQNPNADTQLVMGDHHIKFSFNQPLAGGGVDGAFELEATGAFTGDILHIHQHTGSPAAVDLLHLEAASTTALPLRIVTSGASVAANITGRFDLTGTTGTAGTRDLNILTTITSGTGGIRIKAGSQSADLATVELIGRRDNANPSATFSGTLALAKHRTDALIPLNSRIGRILFGANHTDGSEANILYGGMITGYASGALNSATDFPVGIAFYTGTTGITLSDASEIGELINRFFIRGDGTVGIGVGTTVTTTTLNAPFIISPTFQSPLSSQQGLANNVIFEPTADAAVTFLVQNSASILNKSIGATAITTYAAFSGNLIIDTTNIAPVTAAYCYNVQGVANNSAVTLTTFAGFRVPTLSPANTTNIRGFQGELVAAAGKWNLYMSGTAINHLQGALLIGTTTDDGANKLQVTGNTKLTGNFEVTGTSTIPGYPTNSRTLTGTNSISGGGDLSANRTFSLVNDSAAPGNSKYYGTDGAGVLGYFNLPVAGGLSDGDKGDITVSGSGATWTIDALAVTDSKINDVAWSKITGEPTTLAGYGISDTKANFNTACSDGDFLFVGDITAYTNEEAQDAVGTILLDSDTIDFTYNDATPSITALVKTQLSLTSDASGIKLSGDVASPGNSMLYGTNGSGTKGWYTQPVVSTPTGIFSDIQFSLLQSDGTLNAASGVQTWAGTNKTGQDVFTVAANTTYRIRGQWIINTGNITHTTAMAFAVSGATVTSLEYFAMIWMGPANTITGAQSTIHVTGIASKVLNNTSGAVYTLISFEGILVIGASGGTITPQIDFSANPTGTNLMKGGSWTSFEKLGTDVAVLTGGWA